VLTTAQPAKSARANTPGIAFTGEADRLTLVADMPTGLGTTRRAEITLERSGDDRIVLRWLPRRHEVPLAPAPPPLEATILQHVRDLEFDYWGASAVGGPAAWQQRWNSEILPGLIRIRVRFAPADHRHWPDLVVAPLLTGPAG
jgi:general secretion pathway protein J